MRNGMEPVFVSRVGLSSLGFGFSIYIAPTLQQSMLGVYEGLHMMLLSINILQLLQREAVAT